jgi:hypothetical protein
MAGQNLKIRVAVFVLPTSYTMTTSASTPKAAEILRELYEATLESSRLFCSPEGQHFVHLSDVRVFRAQANYFAQLGLADLAKDCTAMANKAQIKVEKQSAEAAASHKHAPIFDFTPLRPPVFDFDPALIPDSATIPVPVPVPVSAPAAVPVSAPAAVPVSAPAVPVSAPAVVSVSVPAAVPVSVPAAVSVSAPAAVSVSAPAAVPVSAPAAVSVSAPAAVPISAPAVVPVSTRVASIPVPATGSIPARVISVSVPVAGSVPVPTQNPLSAERLSLEAQRKARQEKKAALENSIY